MSWTNWTGSLAFRGPEAGLPPPTSPPLLLKAAAYNGILTNNVQPQTTPCATGNCSWPITPSVAICGGCVETEFSTSCNYDASGISPGICNYTLPSGEIANLTNRNSSGHVGTALKVFGSPGFHFKKSQTDKLYLSNFEAVGMPAGTRTGDISWQNTTDQAYECALWACVQAFETWQVNSNQTQVVRRSWDKVDDSSFRDVNDNVTFVDLPKDMNIQMGDNFSFLQLAAVSLINYLEPLFDGNINVTVDAQFPSSDVIQALWNASADLDIWMKNVASSLTNVIRSFNPAPQRAAFEGTGYQLGYDVRWAWIILPAVLVGTSVLLLAVVMTRTALNDVHPWKGSPLAFLFMNVDDNMATRAHG